MKGQHTSRIEADLLSIFNLLLWQDLFDDNCRPINRECLDNRIPQVFMVTHLVARSEKGLLNSRKGKIFKQVLNF